MPLRRSQRRSPRSTRSLRKAKMPQRARTEKPKNMPAPGRRIEERLKREAEERAVWEQLAQESEAEKAELAAKLTQPPGRGRTGSAQPKVIELVERGEEAATKIDLDEAETRALIDQQLRDRGWEADTKSLRHAAGIRPAKGRNMAIAEWPTASGPADYALFVGTMLVGVVEAKRRRKNVSAAIDQSERYSTGFRPSADFAIRWRTLGRASCALRLRRQWPLLSEADRDRERHLVSGHPPRRQPSPRSCGLADARRARRVCWKSIRTPRPPR